MHWFFEWAVQLTFVVAVGTAFLSYFLPDAPWYHWVGLAFLAAAFIRGAMHIGADSDDH